MERSTLLSVFDFSLSSGLALDEVASMLALGLLPFERGEQGQLLIDVTSLEPQEIARRALAANLPQSAHRHTAVLEEAFATALAVELDSVIRDSVQLALDWLRQDAASGKDGIPDEDESGNPA